MSEFQKWTSQHRTIRTSRDWKNILTDMYYNQGLTQEQISQLVGIPRTTITRWIKKYNVPRPKKFNIEKNELYYLYWNKKMTQREIAKKFGVSQRTIANKMKEYNIPTRNGRRRTEYPCTYEDLYDLYWNKGLSTSEIAKIAELCDGSVVSLLRRRGIPRRSRSEAAKNYYAKGHRPASWKGGRRYNRGYVLIHRPNHPKADRHGYIREHLLVWEEHHKKALPEGWVIHHINGVKDDNRIENLVALPRKKHGTWTLIKIYQKRIRELEEEIKKLRGEKDV